MSVKGISHVVDQAQDSLDVVRRADLDESAVQLHLLGCEPGLPILQLRLALSVLSNLLNRIAARDDTCSP